MLHIVQVESVDQRSAATELLREYLKWLVETVNRAYNTQASADTLLEESMRENGKFSPPTGRMFLAHENDHPAGMICLRKIGAETGEIKRMYVSPAFRGKGVGKALVERLCDEARQIGYTKIRLDSAPFMQSAHTLYHSAGFREIAAYPESEVPAEYHANWLFMERTL